VGGRGRRAPHVSRGERPRERGAGPVGPVVGELSDLVALDGLVTRRRRPRAASSASTPPFPSPSVRIGVPQATRNLRKVGGQVFPRHQKDFGETAFQRRVGPTQGDVGFQDDPRLQAAPQIAHRLACGGRAQGEHVIDVPPPGAIRVPLGDPSLDEEEGIRDAFPRRGGKAVQRPRPLTGPLGGRQPQGGSVLVEISPEEDQVEANAQRSPPSPSVSLLEASRRGIELEVETHPLVPLPEQVVPPSVVGDVRAAGRVPVIVPAEAGPGALGGHGRSRPSAPQYVGTDLPGGGLFVRLLLLPLVVVNDGLGSLLQVVHQYPRRVYPQHVSPEDNPPSIPSVRPFFRRGPSAVGLSSSPGVSQGHQTGVREQGRGLRHVQHPVGPLLPS
jgi:hypothetical protein